MGYPVITGEVGEENGLIPVEPRELRRHLGGGEHSQERGQFRWQVRGRVVVSEAGYEIALLGEAVDLRGQFSVQLIQKLPCVIASVIKEIRHPLQGYPEGGEAFDSQHADQVVDVVFAVAVAAAFGLTRRPPGG
ncbi:MAG: hypothetical protein R2722_07000 [Tessaracoccus sp.]